MRDETDLTGLKLDHRPQAGGGPGQADGRSCIKLTPLQDTFACNFNILIAGMPRVLGVREICWRSGPPGARSACAGGCTSSSEAARRRSCTCCKGLKRILLDIDKAIAIIRETEEEAEVVPNLMIGFGIDEIQAEYVAEIKLRNINKEYILKRMQETDSLQGEIADLEDIAATARPHPQASSWRSWTQVQQEVRPAPANRDHLRATRWRSYREEEQVPDYPVHRVPVP